MNQLDNIIIDSSIVRSFTDHMIYICEKWEKMMVFSVVSEFMCQRYFCIKGVKCIISSFSLDQDTEDTPDIYRIFFFAPGRNSSIFFRQKYISDMIILDDLYREYDPFRAEHTLVF